MKMKNLSIVFNIFIYFINSPLCSNPFPLLVLPPVPCKSPFHPSWVLSPYPGSQLLPPPPGPTRCGNPPQLTQALTAVPDYLVAWIFPTFSSHSLVKVFLPTESILFHLNGIKFILYKSKKSYIFK